MSENVAAHEMWEQSKEVDALLGITEEWLYAEMLMRDAIHENCRTFG